MSADQKKSSGPETKSGGGEGGEGAAGRLFIRQYKATPRYQKDKVEFQTELIEWDDMIAQLKRNGYSDGSPRIKEAQDEKEKVSLKQEIQLFEAPLKDDNLSKEQREDINAYLDDLRAQLKKLEG